MKEIYITRTIIISFLILYILLQLFLYYNSGMLAKDFEYLIESNSGEFGGEINIKELISVSKEYGVYEYTFKTAFTKIGIAFGALILYIVFIYRNRNKNAEIK